jgi:hydrogenase nickel incorporation protein HypB
MKSTIKQNTLQADSLTADEIRNILQEKNIFMVNLISSPGSGKTALLEHTLAKLQNLYSIAVIAGDVETDRDAKRLEQFGIPISLINTHGAYHLESTSIAESLTQFDLDNLDIIFIENVGSLICPDKFDIGEHVKVALISVTEGDDKVLKYPSLFKQANLVVLNKMDLVENTPFNKAVFYNDIKQINPELSVVEISCKHGGGIEDWIHWIYKTHASTDKIKKYDRIVCNKEPLIGVH